MFTTRKQNTFKYKYLGTFYREKGMKTAECVALAKLHAKEVHGITLWYFWGSAYNGIKSGAYDLTKWTWIDNTTTWVPRVWDHVFWWKWMWESGHVAIFDGGNTKVMACLSQNSTWKDIDAAWDEIIVKMYDYKYVLGWYTPKLWI